MGVSFALYVTGNLLTRGASPAVTLGWTETFAFLLPAAAAAAGSNLDAGSFLLLSRRPTRRQVALGALVGAAAFLAAGALLSLASLLFPASWVRAFDLTPLFEGPPLERAALAAIASLVAPFCEEAAFRGYVQSALMARTRPGVAIALSALLFATMHLDPVRFVPVLALGALFGWLAWRAGSLWPAVAAHATNNVVSSILAVSGVADPGDVRPDPRAALATLGVGAIALVPVVLAYRAATPSPPPPGEAVRLRDPADRSLRFEWHRLPTGLLLAAVAGAALLAATTFLAPHPR